MPLPELNRQGLLPEGVHPAVEDDLKARFVDPYPASSTRQKIYGNFCRYRVDVADLGLCVTQWVDGSFVDGTKLDPDDVDVINYCESSALNALDAAVQKRIQPLLNGHGSTKDGYNTHTFLEIRFAAGHPFSAAFDAQRKYWRDWFSRPQDYSGTEKRPAPWRGRKGIVQMSIGKPSHCPVISDAA